SPSGRTGRSGRSPRSRCFAALTTSRARGARVANGEAGRARARVLILVENLSVPADRRVWAESRSLVRAGYDVTVICPAGRTRDTAGQETIEGVSIHRFPQTEAGSGAVGYLSEYGRALWHMRRLARRLEAEAGRF